MGRRRSLRNKDLPQNLYYHKVKKHFVYRHPCSKKYIVLGADKSKAMAAAKEANAMFMPHNEYMEKLVATIMPTEKWCRHFLSVIMPTFDLAEKTKGEYTRQLKCISEHFGATDIDALTILDISKFLGKFPDVASDRYRSLLMQLFKHARANGYCSENLAAQTIPKNPKKKRKRLTMEWFEAIYNHPHSSPYLRNAMRLGLLSLQRLWDLTSAKFTDINTDEHGTYWKVIQHKTFGRSDAAYLKIYLWPELHEAIKNCRDDIASPYLIHRKPHRIVARKDCDHPTQITKSFLSKEFSSLRDDLKICADVGALQRPSFHEIRSLGIHRYKEAGIDPQQLAGHSSAKMTQAYAKGHKIEWQVIHMDGLSI